MPGIQDTLGTLIGETSRIWRTKLNQRLKPLGLSQSQWLVLFHLSKSEGDLVQKELAERIGIEAPTLVGILDRMNRDGWVERSPCEGDRRSKNVHLTEQAHSVLETINAEAVAMRRELLGEIPTAELEQCARVLRRIKERAESL